MSKKSDIENAVKGLNTSEVTKSLISSSPAGGADTQSEYIKELERKLREQITAEVRAELGAESKTVRVNFLLRPSIYNKLKERAELEGVSLNEEVNRLLTHALAERE